MLQIYYYGKYGLKTLQSITTQDEIFISDSDYPYIVRLVRLLDQWKVSSTMTSTQFVEFTKNYYKKDKKRVEVPSNQKRDIIFKSRHYIYTNSDIKFTKEVTFQLREFRKKIFGKELLSKCSNTFYNERYKARINSMFFVVKFEDLDPESMLYRISSMKTFHNTWSIFTKNYKLLKPILQKNLWARQKLITFLAYHNKMEKLGMRKYNWIMKTTPEFYLMGFKTREVNNHRHCRRHPQSKVEVTDCKYADIILKKKLAEQSNKHKNSDIESYDIDIDISNGTYKNSYGKYPCNCDKESCRYLARRRVFTTTYNYRYGTLNKTQAIYNIFSRKQQDLINVSTHFTTLERFYNIDPHYFIGYYSLDIYGKSNQIKDFKLYFKNNKDYLKKYIDMKFCTISHSSRHILYCKDILINIMDHAWDLLDKKTQAKLQKCLLITI